MTTLHYEEIEAERPRRDDLRDAYREIEDACAAARAAADLTAAVRRWDVLRRRLGTWTSLTDLRFNQDTRNPEFKAARDYCDELRPLLTELAADVKRRLLASPHRGELEGTFGRQAFALWEADVLSFDPAISEEMVRESKLEADYTELLASARVEFQGREWNLSEIVKFRDDPDRRVRHGAEAARWGWFRDNAETLDDLYDDLVRLRTTMARKLGYDDYVALGYKRMYRIDYDRADVERFREVVRRHVVPLARELRRGQARDLGVDRLMYWDMSVHDPAGNPMPEGGHDWLLERAGAMFDALGGGDGLASFYGMMADGGFLDLEARAGKAGGGFCTSFPAYGMPFIFANFNGTKGDVEVFTHEMGHAFQNWSSRGLALDDYLWPTMESCEIHSMSLEFLAWPHMEMFFGEDAERFRRIHLAQSLLFLPYGVAVDHFQHRVYEEPDAGPAERKRMWQEIEGLYLPGIDYGDLHHAAAGGMWQTQSHIYLSPFYYIDYTLAMCCALQFWMRARRDPREALDSYVALCRRGGEAPFLDLVRSARLRSPFAPGTLEEVIEAGRAELETE